MGCLPTVLEMASSWEQQKAGEELWLIRGKLPFVFSFSSSVSVGGTRLTLTQGMLSPVCPQPPWNLSIAVLCLFPCSDRRRCKAVAQEISGDKVEGKHQPSSAEMGNGCRGCAEVLGCARDRASALLGG